MAEFNFNKLQSMDLSKQIVNFRDPTQEIMYKLNRENEAILRASEETRRERETEALRRHDELIASLKEAGDKGATIVIGDNANGIQIQQNSNEASQKMKNSQGLDYEKTMSVLKEISCYFEYPQFQQTFGVNTANVKQMVNDIMSAIEKKEDEGLIKKSLLLLKDLTVGATGSMIASGILGLLGTLPIG